MSDLADQLTGALQAVEIKASTIRAALDRLRGAEQGVEPYDPAAPPLFESQATYLERHRLLLPGERRLLRSEDFEPERVGLVFEHGTTNVVPIGV